MEPWRASEWVRGAKQVTEWLGLQFLHKAPVKWELGTELIINGQRLSHPHLCNGTSMPIPRAEFRDLGWQTLAERSNWKGHRSFSHLPLRLSFWILSLWLIIFIVLYPVSKLRNLSKVAFWVLYGILVSNWTWVGGCGKSSTPGQSRRWW